MSFVSYILNGISLGSVYAIIALGYTMVYGIAKMLNFAHGDIIMVGSYVAFLAINSMGLPVPVAIVLSVIVCTVLGMVIERSWGTLRFNLFYLSGVVMMDIFCMFIPGCRADASHLNTSLFLAYATMFPDATFLFMMIIPIKAWFFAILELVLVLLSVIQNRFPYNLFPIIAIANYFLFFGADVLNIFPLSFRLKLQKLFRVKPKAKGPKVINFHVTQKPQQEKEQQNYNHRCTVCGRTDVTNPELEFRYCSKCKGYYCYCQDHINNHVHIQ